MIIFVSKNGWLLNHEPFLSHSLLSELLGVFIAYLFYDLLYISDEFFNKIAHCMEMESSPCVENDTISTIFHTSNANVYQFLYIYLWFFFMAVFFICAFSSWPSNCLTISVQMAIELKTNRCNFIKKWFIFALVLIANHRCEW